MLCGGSKCRVVVSRVVVSRVVVSRVVIRNDWLPGDGHKTDK